MCEPVTAVAIGATVASTAHGMYSAHQQAKVARAAGRRNEHIARQAAADAEQRGELEASKVTSAGVRQMARAKATMLAQGIYGDSEGVKDLLEGMATNIALDAETIRNNAARQAWGLRNQADTSRFEGEAAAHRAEQEAIGTGLSGIAQVASIASASYGKPKPGKSGLNTTVGN